MANPLLVHTASSSLSSIPALSTVLEGYLTVITHFISSLKLNKDSCGVGRIILPDLTSLLLDHCETESDSEREQERERDGDTQVKVFVMRVKQLIRYSKIAVVMTVCASSTCVSLCVSLTHLADTVLAVDSFTDYSLTLMSLSSSISTSTNAVSGYQQQFQGVYLSAISFFLCDSSYFSLYL